MPDQPGEADRAGETMLIPLPRQRLTSNCHAQVGAISGRGAAQLRRPPSIGPHRMLEQVREIIVRSSVEDHVPAMIAIYTHHIQRGLGGFDFEPLDPNDIKRRRKNMLKHRLPHLVAEQDGVIVGYAYAVLFRKRPAYRYTVKNSIYVHPTICTAASVATSCRP